MNYFCSFVSKVTTFTTLFIEINNKEEYGYYKLLKKHLFKKVKPQKKLNLYIYILKTSIW